jgi:hypothetical protein
MMLDVIVLVRPVSSVDIGDSRSSQNVCNICNNSSLILTSISL